MLPVRACRAFAMSRISIAPFRRHGVPWVLALLLAGCAGPVAVESPPVKEARLVLVNQTGYSWQVSLTRSPESGSRLERLAPYATREIALAPGRYDIEQTLAPGEAGIEQTRKLAVTLEAGTRYRWPLATVLSHRGEVQGEGANSP